MDYETAKKLFPHPHMDYIEKNVLGGLNQGVKEVGRADPDGPGPVQEPRAREVHGEARRAESERRVREAQTGPAPRERDPG